MDRRIFGLENEYGVTCTFRGQRRLSPDEVARYLFRRVVSWGRSSNVFLRNGARLYLDVGSHPEYATPECDNVTELVTLLGQSQSRVSNHLACLRWCGYVDSRREGKFVYYRVSDPRVRQLVELARGVIADHAAAILSCTRM